MRIHAFLLFSFVFCVPLVPSHGWIARHPQFRHNLDLIDLADDDGAGPSNAAAVPAAVPIQQEEEANRDAAVIHDAAQEFNRFRMTETITMLYNSFLAAYREEMLINSMGANSVLNLGTLRHRKMMTEIDRHFLDCSAKRFVDADLVRYLAELDTNEMNSFDRVRMPIMSTRH